ncbi:arginine--tRNA ligase [Dyadobacter chenwenxiniae]|uniref:Arginine--tRNA ligase n=1 Tax=Dyadobacter chenwenxiniae TaxID=2906456 RepID=A0A9X1PS03_9BACT|nr:arginine--tRNA ligase [Dyadobacter chenwenxiniae]MCF0065039.1 arginine--tRNA ligase [Dyadobacter chenwenxiniae]UON83155.1 arginine--tRNA ligase [Dyadobacter chenwenxiniae]
MTIEAILKDDIQKAIQKHFDIAVEDIILQPTKKEFEGFYTFVTFPLTKSIRKTPAEIGQIIGTELAEHSSVADKFNVVQGFLNISLKDTTWLELFSKVFNNQNFGTFPSNGQSVMVEFSSPNTNKPLHLGHLRNNFLGDSLSKILKASGYDVVKTCLVNDRGIHICKSMLAYRELGNGETPESSGIKGDKLAGKYYVMFDGEYKRQIRELVEQGMPEEEATKKAPWILEAQKLLLLWENNDPETVALWHKMNGWVYEGFRQTYDKIGVGFDKTYYESNTYLLGKDIIEEGLQNNVFYKKPDNSVWIDLSAEGLDEKLVLRGDGTSVYITQDLGTTELKYGDFHNNRYLWVVGNEQDYHFKVLFAILKKLGRPYADGCYHISYGMVDLPSGKMKSREGTVVDADDLVEQMIQTAASRTQELGKIDDFDSAEAKQLYNQLALGALKYFLLKVDPKKRMLFNPEESIDFQGHTGPFIQYTYARIRSITRKAEQSGIQPVIPPVSYVLHPAEKELIFALSQYPVRVLAAANEFAPSVISLYAFELAKVYNQFYAEVSIFSDPNPEAVKFRVALSRAVSETIQKALGLLGIEVPERM